jgi:dihydroorotate dehydrogenase
MIVSNTTIARPGLTSSLAGESGGLSGAPLMVPSTVCLARVYRLTGGRLPLIGTGGISSAADAWEKLRAGASLLQLYSALVYKGPELVADILSGLLDRLDANGLTSLAEVTGSGVDDWLNRGETG